MIIIGAATVNPSTGKVELKAPVGFGTARGIRLSNYNVDTLTLTNISGVDQSQEYLPPQTQMVYMSVNIGRTPTLIGVTLASAQIAAGLLVEWSTDPDNDFIGTYPTPLPVPGFTAPDPLTFVQHVNGSTVLTLYVGNYKTLWLSHHTTGSSASAQVTLAWQDSITTPGVGNTRNVERFDFNIGNSSITNDVVNAISTPVKGNYVVVTVPGSVTINLDLYGSVYATEGQHSYSNAPAGHGTFVQGAGAQGTQFTSAGNGFVFVGPGRLQFSASINDTTSTGYLAFIDEFGNNLGIIDSTKFFTDSFACLNTGLIEAVVPPGVQALQYQQTVGAGGTWRFAYTLQPL